MLIVGILSIISWIHIISKESEVNKSIAINCGFLDMSMPDVNIYIFISLIVVELQILTFEDYLYLFLFYFIRYNVTTSTSQNLIQFTSK